MLRRNSSGSSTIRRLRAAAAPLAASCNCRPGHCNQPALSTSSSYSVPAHSRIPESVPMTITCCPRLPGPRMRGHVCCNGKARDPAQSVGGHCLFHVHRFAGSAPDRVARDPGRRCVCWRLADCCNYCLTPCPTRMVRHPPLAALLGVAPLPFVAAGTANNVALVAKAQQRRKRGAQGAEPSSQFPSPTTALRFPVAFRLCCAALPALLRSMPDLSGPAMHHAGGGREISTARRRA